MFREVCTMVLAVFFIGAGVNHFISPEMYEVLVPGYLPWPYALVILSGIAEVLGGVGIAFRRTRWLAGWWLIVVLVAVFPANIHMLVNNVPVAGRHLPEWLLWARLPFQAVLIGWVYLACIRKVAGLGLSNRNPGVPGK